MNEKERLHATLEGKPVDRLPVTVLYNMLYHNDHFNELTGQPPWQWAQWLYSEPEEHLRLFSAIHEKAPFEILQPHTAPPREERQNSRFIEKYGQHFRYNVKFDMYTPLNTLSGHANDYIANEEQYIVDIKDINDYIEITPAEELIAQGLNDYAEAIVKAYGKDHFILTGGVIGTIYSCGAYVGQTNTFILMRENPSLIDYLCVKITEKNIEQIRRIAAVGGDAIYIDDATATNDMISVHDYETFSLPYMKTMVNEIHRLGHKAILLYYGGIADRLEQIASIGADGLSMETSMKNYVNDVEAIVKKIGDRVTVFGNIDPYGVLEKGSDEELETEMRRQAQAGRQGRGFVMCTGSPITVNTPLSRVQLFLELGKKV